jgi:hypothetical protein
MSCRKNLQENSLQCGLIADLVDSAEDRINNEYSNQRNDHAIDKYLIGSATSADIHD